MAEDTKPEDKKVEVKTENGPPKVELSPRIVPKESEKVSMLTAPDAVQATLGDMFGFTFGTIGLYCLSLTPPSYGAEAKDITGLQDGAHKFMPGLNSPGEATLKVLWDGANANQQALLAIVGVNEYQTATYTHPDGSTISGLAYIASFEPDEVNPDEPLEGTIAVQHSGVITYGAAS